MKLYMQVLLFCACVAALGLASDTCTKVCIMDVIQCKRGIGRTKGSNIDTCCKAYRLCFNECDAGYVPSCGPRGGKRGGYIYGKRGSWNKRERYGYPSYDQPDAINFPYFV